MNVLMKKIILLVIVNFLSFTFYAQESTTDVINADKWRRTISCQPELFRIILAAQGHVPKSVNNAIFEENPVGQHEVTRTTSWEVSPRIRHCTDPCFAVGDRMGWLPWMDDKTWQRLSL